MCTRQFWIVVCVFICNTLILYQECNAQTPVPVARMVNNVWQIAPTSPFSWSSHHRIPMFLQDQTETEEFEDDLDGRGKKDKYKLKKKYKKFLLPLLIAYKLKFFALIPIMIGGLLLLTGATGLAGFFFALFAASMGFNKGH